MKQFRDLSGCQKSCMRSDNKLVSVRAVGPPTKSYQVCPFLATISQDKSRKKRGWIKKYGWGQKSRPINGQPANWGWTRVSSIISPWYRSWLWSFLPDRTKEPKYEVRKCIERNNSLVLNGHLRYHGIVNTCCASLVSDHIMSPDGAWVYWQRKTPTDRFFF